jgi:hypothetical protein
VGWTWKLIARAAQHLWLCLQGAHAPLCLGAGAAAGGGVHAALALPGGLGGNCRGWGWGWGWGCCAACAAHFLCCWHLPQTGLAWSLTTSGVRRLVCRSPGQCPLTRRPWQPCSRANESMSVRRNGSFPPASAKHSLFMPSAVQYLGASTRRSRTALCLQSSAPTPTPTSTSTSAYATRLRVRPARLAKMGIPYGHSDQDR